MNQGDSKGKKKPRREGELGTAQERGSGGERSDQEEKKIMGKESVEVSVRRVTLWLG